MRRVYVMEIRGMKRGKAGPWKLWDAFSSRNEAEKWVWMSKEADKRWPEKFRYEYRIRTGKLDPLLRRKVMRI